MVFANRLKSAFYLDVNEYGRIIRSTDEDLQTRTLELTETQKTKQILHQTKAKDLERNAIATDLSLDEQAKRNKQKKIETGRKLNRNQSKNYRKSTKYLPS